MEPGLAEELTVERDYLCQMRVIFQDGYKLRAYEPANLCVRETSSQGREGRQSKDYVTDRAGLYYENVFKIFRHNRAIIRRRGTIGN